MVQHTICFNFGYSIFTDILCSILLCVWMHACLRKFERVIVALVLHVSALKATCDIHKYKTNIKDKDWMVHAVEWDKDMSWRENVETLGWKGVVWGIWVNFVLFFS
jgi:hypothetical protein